MRRNWNGKGKEDEKSTEKTSAPGTENRIGKYLVIFPAAEVATIGLKVRFSNLPRWQYDHCV